MIQKFAKPAKSQFGKYLFCYFVGNAPDEETIHFAVSEDGYHFRALNNNQPVIKQTKGKLANRDPFLFRGQNGEFYIIATDMRSELGWASNNSMISWRSTDLINWTDETVIDFSQFEETKTADRVWAPEVIFDQNKGEYMIYWSNHNANSDDNTTSLYYAYSKDMKTLTTKPCKLFRPSNGLDAIDADIIFNNGKYYMYYKDEYNKTICLVIADNITGPYCEYPDNVVACTPLHVEGNCMYKINGTDTYVMIMDKYVDGGYFMQQTTDMLNFEPVCEDDFSLNHLRPRHGSMLSVTDEEYNALINHFGIGE